MRLATAHSMTAARTSALGVAITFLMTPALFAQEPAPRWFKGNTHTHTLNSDGDSTPDDVVRWYREHGYHFVVLTDHNFLTSVDALNALHGAHEQFIVIKGEEVTDRFGDKPIHVNGLDVEKRVGAQGGGSVTEVLQRNVDAIRAARGIPHVNHPNFGWAITADDLGALRNTRLFEIFNGHPRVNNAGGGGEPGLEEIWDRLLSRGILLYGLAVDDAHTFKMPGNPDVPGPGRGWVMVRAARLEPSALLTSLERGEFYSSTGVELDSYDAATTRIAVAVKPTSFSKYRIQFIGRDGKLLHEATEPRAEYRPAGDERYVRVRVIESNGRMAWMQPLLVPAPAASMVPQSTALATAVLAALLLRLRPRFSPSRARHD
jgi:hypothetical protein